MPTVLLTYTASAPSGYLTGFPSDLPVTVNSGGVSTTYAAGANVPYLAGDKLSFGGVTVTSIPAAVGSYTVDPAITLEVPVLSKISAATANTGALVIGTSVSNAAALTGSNYKIDVTDADADLVLEYTITRASDNSVVYTGASLPSTPVDGINFTGDAGVPLVGDSYMLTFVAPTVSQATGNTGNLAISASVADATAVTGSAYTIGYDGTNYTITRSSDNTVAYTGAALPAAAIDGLNFTGVGTPATGDKFTLTSGTKTLTGLPSYLPVTVTRDGVSTVYAAGADVAYSDGATISYGGISFTLSGKPDYADTFTIASNKGGTGDNRNALLLGGLQTTNVIGGSTSYEGAYSQLVNMIGNKTGELESTSKAAASAYTAALDAQQSQSGVNLDEEAANLMHYQQAYQAAAKVMQTANEMFDALLAIMS